MIFISVDLPAPFSPSTAWICPGATRRLTRSLALTAGYDLLMSTSSRRSIAKEEDGSGRVAIVVRPAGDERLDKIALVGQRHPREDALMQAARHGRAARRDRADGGVPDADVGSRADIERADLALEAERMRRPARRRMPPLPCRPPLAGQGLDLVGVGHVAKHRQAGAAADVAGEADIDACGLGGAPVEQAAAEEQVRRRR